jgi:hypothetical protein
VTIQRGGTLITDVRHGTTLINEVRRGSTLVWTRSVIRDDFDRPDAETLGADWADLGPSSDRLIGINNGYARLIIPDGTLGGFWSLRTSRARFTKATSVQVDGYVECRVGSRGDGKSATSLVGYTTQVFGRVNNTGTFNNGIGIELSAGHVWIASRIGTTDARKADGGTFQPGDRLRLTYVTNTHTLFRNGTQVAQWVDSGATVAKGASYASMLLRCDGAKDLLGPRRFSPSVDSVLMS